MRAVIFDFIEKRFSFVESAKIPIPSVGEVLVRVKAAALNPIEGKHEIWSSLVPEEARDQFIMGVDVAGVVESMNLSSTTSSDLKVGDRVVCHPWLPDGKGGFADFCMCRHDFLVRIPENVSFESAAATPVAGWTAYKALMVKLRIQPNTSVVITGGNGGLGGYGLQLARMVGCSPIITTCSVTSNERVRSLGATHCIDYRSEDIVAQIMEITGNRGVDYVMDGISGESAKLLSQALTFDGQIACVAGVMPRDPSESYFRGISVHDVCLASCAYLGGPQGLSLWSFMGQEVMRLLQQSKLDPMIGKVISLDEVCSIYNSAAQPSNGKTVVVIDASTENAP